MDLTLTGHRLVVTVSSRICVGRHVATNGLFINIASLLWAATVSPVTDNEGNKVIPDTFAFINNGLVLYVFDSYLPRYHLTSFVFSVQTTSGIQL